MDAGEAQRQYQAALEYQRTLRAGCTLASEEDLADAQREVRDAEAQLLAVHFGLER